jgi:hypothetical protein
MKRVLLLMAIALLIPGMLGATAMLGLYFAPGQMALTPAPGTPFKIYLYLHQADYFITGIEYQLLTPSDPTHVMFSLSPSIEYPDNMTVNLGDPFNGHSIGYYPPFNGFVPGYNLMCTMTGMITVPCSTMYDYSLVIGPHPESGELRGTYAPDNDFFPIIGLTSRLCPEAYATDETSWGAIKSLYK